MARALIEAMFTAEGLIIGTAWVVVWATFTCLAGLALEAFERRASAQRHGLNTARAASGEE